MRYHTELISCLLHTGSKKVLLPKTVAVTSNRGQAKFEMPHRATTITLLGVAETKFSPSRFRKKKKTVLFKLLKGLMHFAWLREHQPYWEWAWGRQGWGSPPGPGTGCCHSRGSSATPGRTCRAEPGRTLGDASLTHRGCRQKQTEFQRWCTGWT